MRHFTFGLLAATIFVISACEKSPSDPADNLEYSVFETWWDTDVDSDNDGYYQYKELNFDVDVSSGTELVTVKVYYRVSGTTTYSLYTTTPEFEITDYSYEDAKWVAIGAPNTELAHGTYDFMIKVFRGTSTTVKAEYGPDDDSTLGQVGIESSAEDTPSVIYSIYNAWWTNEVDNDADYYYQYARLNFDADVSSGTHTVYAKIGYKSSSSSVYTEYYTTPEFDITESATSDEQWVSIGSPNLELSHGLYDFRIELFPAGSLTAVVTADAEDDGDLSSEAFELAAEDGESTETYTVYNAWWTDAVDNDSDGYTWGRNLNMDIDCSDGTHDIYVRLLYKTSASGSYTEYFTTGVFSITDYSTGDAIWIAVGSPNAELSNSTYDFKIEVYKSGGSTVMVMADPDEDSDLNDIAFEYVIEDGALDQSFTVYNSWWTDSVDSDFDGYDRYAKLTSDIDVASGIYPVSLKIWYKLATSTTYTTYYTTQAYKISNSSEADEIWVAIGSPNTELSHNAYDFKVEVFVPHNSGVLASSDKNSDSDLGSQPFEYSSED